MPSWQKNVINLTLLSVLVKMQPVNPKPTRTFVARPFQGASVSLVTLMTNTGGAVK
jgi:hypothetical protein